MRRIRIRSRRRRSSHHAAQHPAPRAALDPPQPAALVPDHPGHRDRRQRGDHHGHAGQRRHAGGADADLQPRHQPADGASGSAPGARRRGWRRRRTVVQGGRCRGDPGADRRHPGGGAGRPHRRDRGRQRPQLGHQRHRQQQRLVRHRQLEARLRAHVHGRRAAGRRGRLRHRRDGAARDLRRHAAAWASSCASSSSPAR